MEEHSSVVTIRNATRTATVWATSPVGLLVRVEVLVTVSCALLATIVFLSSVRRTSGSGSFRLVVWISLMLCYPAVTYTIGLIQSSSFRNELAVVWACFLIGCADSIFVCSIDEQASTVLNQATQVIYVLLLLVSYISSLELHLKIMLVLLWVLNIAKLGMRLWSLASAGREARDRILTTENWLISKYMAHEYARKNYDFDPETMEGYRYVVAGNKDGKQACGEYEFLMDDDLITLERLGLPDEPSKDKLEARDLCLSFALFKLLRRRLSGYPVPERDNIKTLTFVKRGLAGGDYQRMYRVIEVELGFLYDFFYARYQLPNQSLIPETAMVLASVSLSLSILLSPALRHYNNSGNRMKDGFVTTGLDIWLARFVIFLFMILELFQYLTVLLSDWHKVRIVCRIVRTQRRCRPMFQRIGWFLCRATITTRYWSNSVGQYTLLHACLEDQLSWLAQMPLHRWIKDQHSRIRTVTRRNLPVTVKIAIHQLLQSEWLSNLKYGDRTLQRHNLLHAFDWCTSGYQYGYVGSILVWHIATTIYLHLSGAQKFDSNREVATTLSTYCAYLLFHAPELLSDQMTDQIYETRRLTEALQLIVHQFLKRQGCHSKDDMFQQLARLKVFRLTDSGPGRREMEILADGVRLGHQIFQEMPGEETVRWKVLSEMWVEILLSVAPSDNGMIHVQKLATGGELITHIWALLTHGGVIDMPKRPYYT